MTIKLSDTQDAAIREVAELGYTVAKANTIKSLEGKRLIESTGGTHHKLTDAGREYLGLPEKEAVEQDFHEKLMESVEELEKALQGDPWKIGDQITADEPYLEFAELPMADWERELLHGAPEVAPKPQNDDENPFLYFDEAWNNATRVEAGFGETLKWKNTKVWDGLTAEEIREDMDTRVPANRADKRMHARVTRKAFKQLANAL